MRKMFWVVGAVMTVAGGASANVTTPVLPAATGNAIIEANGGSVNYPSPIPLSTFGKNYSVYIPDTLTLVTTQNTPGEITWSSNSNGVGESATVIDNGSPLLSASVSHAAGTPSTNHTLGEGFLYYDFELVQLSAPSLTSPVTVGVNSTASVAATSESSVVQGFTFNSGTAEASLDIRQGTLNLLQESAQADYQYTSGGDDAVDTINATGTLGVSSSFSGGFQLKDTPLNLQTDTVYGVIMAVRTGGNGDLVLDASASVDPSFVVPQGYELVLSPGIGSGIPETSAWMMMLVGFCGLGAMVRSRNSAKVLQTRT